MTQVTKELLRIRQQITDTHRCKLSLKPLLFVYSHGMQTMDICGWSPPQPTLAMGGSSLRTLTWMPRERPANLPQADTQTVLQEHFEQFKAQNTPHNQFNSIIK